MKQRTQRRGRFRQESGRAVAMMEQKGCQPFANRGSGGRFLVLIGAFFGETAKIEKSDTKW